MIPVLGSIKTFEDVKRAFDTLRAYFNTTPSVGNLSVTQPKINSVLTINDGKEFKVTETWELRDVNGGVVDQVVDSTKFVEVIINNKKVKLAVLT
jgi:hypothetical protein